MPPDPDFALAFDRVFAPSNTVLLPTEEFVVPVDLSAETLPRATVWRTSDLARVEFRFVNLALTDDDGGRRMLARKVDGRPAFLIAGFGPQHLLEQAFFDAGGTGVDDPDQIATGGTEIPGYPVGARLSRLSRLAYRVTTERIPYSTAGLLRAMSVLPLSVVPHAEGFSRLVRWNVVADDVGALTAITKLAHAAVKTARRSTLSVTATRSRVLRDIDRIDGALTDVARLARLSRTADELAERFGAHSAVAAVADSIRAGVEIGPAFPVDLRPPIPREPSQTETALEIPWRLQLSPHSGSGFAHSLDEVEHDGRVELWHTRLGSRTDAAATADLAAESDPTAPRTVNESEPGTRTVRAVWTRDFRPGAGPENKGDAFPEDSPGDLTTQLPFRATLHEQDRMQLVHLSSNHRWSNGYTPQPMVVENLMLTSIGGWLAGEAHFEPPTGLSIEEWKHRATMGRDHYVKVVKSGVLLPFGHRASLVKITERRVKQDGRATLYQRFFVVVRQPERRFLASGRKEYDNVMPFRWVRILTPSTPPLALPKKLTPTAAGMIFVPEIATSDEPQAGGQPPTGQVPFRFKLMANDIDNRVVEFEGPLIWVEKTAFESTSSKNEAARVAANAVSPAFDLRGQRIAYAKPDDPDDTTLATASATFDALFDTATPGKKRNYVLPVMRVAKATVPAMSAFTGQTAPLDLTYATAYRDKAFGNGNQGGVFLQVSDSAGSALAAATPLQFGSQSDRSGGFLSPSVEMTALARKVGPVGGDLAKLASSPGSFDVGGMFAGLGAAKLFGILPLTDLLPSSGSPLPKFATRVVNTVVGFQQSVTQARAFVLQQKSALDAEGGAIASAATALAAASDVLVNAIVLFGAPPHPPQPFESLITGVTAAATDLRAAFVPGTTLQVPRPVIEQTDALLKRIADVAADAAVVAALIESFYTGSLLPEKVNARLEWETELVPWAPLGVTPPVFQPNGDKTLRLVSEVQAPFTGGAPTALVSCALPPFTLTLLGGTQFIAINVTVMEFSVRPGQKPDVNVKLDPEKGIEFLGPLSFVEALKEVIPFDGFSDPPYLDVQPSGLKAGFDLAIPDLAVGVFALTNISLGAELSVPFIGESLEFRFFFATRENPFRLSVMFFAGGGFFSITISPKGLRVIEASFEFGAAVEMSFVVASGSLSVMAGIYFRLEIAGDTQSVQLTGFFRARGEVDVLGLISACIELYLALEYRSIAGPGGDSAKAVGKASISIEVSVCFLSFSVSVSCEKQFAGSSGDPTFVDGMGAYVDALGAARDPWAEYCAAFAPEPV